MTQTNPEQWAVELWRKACYDYGGMSIEGGWGERNAALAIQAAFAEREARLVGALEPFAAMAAAYDPDEGDDPQWAYASRPTIGQVRNARATLTALKDRTHD